MRNENVLFSRIGWHDVASNQRNRMQEEITKFDGNRLLNSSIEDMAAYFQARFAIEVPELRIDELTVDQREAEIDVSRDPMRMVFDRSRPAYVTGTMIEVEIPFAGEAEVFRVQPTSFTLSPPRGHVDDDRLIIQFEGIDLNAEAVRTEIDRTVKSVQDALATLRSDAASLNEQLLVLASSTVESRRNKLLADRNLVGSLGFKMKERAGAARTFAAPEIRRKITVPLPAASSEPFKPEPTLSTSDYEHILGVVQSMAQVMERSPSAFVGMDEESLRSHFLVQLNGHYEGQATGETFNYDGKTDILIRSEGRNVFIAECKFWAGPKLLTEAIDQLLSYSSWRDTKVAVIVFNRNKDFSKVLQTIRETTVAHPNCKRELPGSGETSFRYCFAQRDDRNREMLLTVLAFDVPQK